MGKDKIKGGKADKLSIEDIAKKHNVSIESIKEQLKIGKKVELEHVDDEDLAEEIAMDHLEEIPDYYTRLNKMEKEAKKELNEEARKMMALAGLQENDKKFLTNESFYEEGPQLDKDKMNPGAWKGMDSMPIGSSPKAPEPDFDGDIRENEAESKDDSDFIISEFDQIEVEPGEDDDKLYKLG